MSLDLGELTRSNDDPPPYSNIQVRENTDNPPDTRRSVFEYDCIIFVKISRPTELPMVEVHQIHHEVHQIMQSTCTIQQPVCQTEIFQATGFNNEQN